MDVLSDLIKTMCAGVGMCDVCGCELTVNKTFFRECFSCGATMWKNLNKEDGHGQGRTEVQGT